MTQDKTKRTQGHTLAKLATESNTVVAIHRLTYNDSYIVRPYLTRFELFDGSLGSKL